jgi:hypothetical protein
MAWAVLGAALLAGDLSLFISNAGLRRKIAGQMEASTGMQVPTMRGFNVQNKPVTVRFGPGPPPALVMAFSPICGFCEEDFPRWDALMRAADGRPLRAVAVNLDGSVPADYILSHSLENTTLVARLDPGSKHAYRLDMAPMTMLISGRGRVLGVWLGVLGKRAFRQAEDVVRDLPSQPAAQTGDRN